MTHIQKCLPLIYVLSQTNPVLTIVSCLPKTHFNIIPSLHTGVQNWVYPSDVPTGTLYGFVIFLTHVTSLLISPPLIDLTAIIKFNEQIFGFSVILMIGIHEAVLPKYNRTGTDWAGI
jgi:hypothetical protein